MKLHDYDFTGPVPSWDSWHTCPTCQRRYWRSRVLVTAIKVAIGFFAVIGAGGFVMGMAQVLGF